MNEDSKCNDHCFNVPIHDVPNQPFTINWKCAKCPELLWKRTSLIEGENE